MQKQSIVQDLESYFICPITQDRLNDPVITDDGHTFQRTVIQQWLDKSLTSPLTGLKLQNKTLRPNILVKKIIQNFYQKRMPSILRKKSKIHQSANNQIQTLKDQLYAKQLQIQQLTYLVGLRQKSQAKSSSNNKIQPNFNEQQIAMQLQKIIPNMSLLSIEQKLKSFKLYKKISFQQIKVSKSCYNNIEYSQNAYRLTFASINISFYQLTKIQLKNVEYLEFQLVNIKNQQMIMFLDNVQTTFPKLTLLYFYFCKFTKIHWDILVRNINKLANIQALIIWNSDQQQQQESLFDKISQQDLRQFKLLRKLKFLCFEPKHYLSQSSKQALIKFKWQNKQIKLQI